MAYTGFPLRALADDQANSANKRLNRETRRRIRMAGTFPDGKSASMLIIARLKYVAVNEWGPAAV